MFELEKQAIFNRTWPYVCHLSRVRAEHFCGFVFVNLDPSTRPIMAGRKGLDHEIRELSLPTSRSTSSRASARFP